MQQEITTKKRPANRRYPQPAPSAPLSHRHKKPIDLSLDIERSRNAPEENPIKVEPKRGLPNKWWELDINSHSGWRTVNVQEKTRKRF